MVRETINSIRREDEERREMTRPRGRPTREAVRKEVAEEEYDELPEELPELPRRIPTKESAPIEETEEPERIAKPVEPKVKVVPHLVCIPIEQMFSVMNEKLDVIINYLSNAIELQEIRKERVA